MHFAKIQTKFTMTCNESEQLDAKRMLKCRPNGQRQPGKPLKRLLEGETGLLRLNS
jgi:hypothetical protein